MEENMGLPERLTDQCADAGTLPALAGALITLIEHFERVDMSHGDRAAIDRATKAYADYQRVQKGQPNRLTLMEGALQQIADLEPRPSVSAIDWQAVDCCEDCQRYKDHPIQRGICDTHRRPIWDREKHQDHEEMALGYRAKGIARDALNKASQTCPPAPVQEG